jgi:hypothetical protein
LCDSALQRIDRVLEVADGESLDGSFEFGEREFRCMNREDLSQAEKSLWAETELIGRNRLAESAIDGRQWHFLDLAGSCGQSARFTACRPSLIFSERN